MRPAVTPRLRLRRLLSLALLSGLWGGTALGHQWTITEAAVSLLPEEGRFQVDFIYDYDAVLADFPPGAMTNDVFQWLMENTTPEERTRRIEDIKASVRRNVRLMFDGKEAAFEVALPELTDPPADAFLRPGGPWPGHIARLAGAIPEGAAAFTLSAAKIYGPVALKFVPPGLDYRALAEAPLYQMVDPLAESRPWPLAPGAEPPAPSTAATAWQYLVLGFEHIIPKGLDHILFVLGLFLLSAQPRPLLWQVTAFTLAHSLTLALSIHGVVSLPAGVVEPLIAASIVVIAVENIATSRLHAWRPALVFVFGLLHGLGFAGVLTELGLPRGQFVTALVTFNIGVELGQLGVIALAFALVGWHRNNPRYRARVVIPASCVIGATGAWWTFERIFL